MWRSIPTIRWFSRGERLLTLLALVHAKVEPLAQIYWLNELHNSRVIEHADYGIIFG